MAGLIALVGPTAAGKTALAVALARRLGKAELLNADSRQVVRGLAAATFAPSPAELQGVPCHLLGLCDPGERFTVAQWLLCARSVLEEIGGRGASPILVGGTGLYVDALVLGFDLRDGHLDAELRRRRTELAGTPAGLAALAGELERRDPAGAPAIDLRNPRRVIRALEILDGGAGTVVPRGRAGGVPARVFVIEVEASLHHRLIRERARTMFGERALLDEVEAALKRGVAPAALARSGIGHEEALQVLRGALTVEQAIEAVIARTIRYARAQRTWFRRSSGAVRVRRDAGTGVGDLLDQVWAAL